MEDNNSGFLRRIPPSISALVILVLTFAIVAIPSASVTAQLPTLDPNAVRAAALDMGMGSLANVVVNDPPELLLYVRSTAPAADATTNPPTPAPPQSLLDFATANGLTVPKAALLILGKSLFWDQQAGSDGQACASCHFIAGTDDRVVNTLNPGSRNEDPTEAVTYNATASGGTGAPNYTLTASDFPFHQVVDPLDTNYGTREVTFDTDDVVGSIGTFHATYAGSPVPNYTLPNATGTYDTPGAAVIDPVFSIGGQNTRSNGPRQAAPTINALFNFRNFWDGRAANTFNGVNPFGAMDQVSLVHWNTGTVLAQDFAAVTNSSLASQSVGPPNSATSDEMAFAGRTMQDLGRKLLRLTSTAATPTASIIPLGAQIVSPTDSVLGTFVNGAGVNNGQGINLTYEELIQWAFVPQYWNSAGPGATTLLTGAGFHLMEDNFALFWGLAVQAYETTLRADQTPYDQFMAGDNNALTQDQMRGLLIYIHTESAVQQSNPIFNNIDFGACQLCHSGPELTENSLVNVPAKFFVTTDMTVTMDHNRELAIVPPSSNFDVGFSNIGTRPNREDIGIGGTVLGNVPLSFFRQGQQGFIFGFLPLFPSNPNPTRGSNTDGSFKIASLRNIELSGPYFHNGGTLTLKQAVEFYARHGDFADVNDPDIDVGLAMVMNITDADINFLVSFLISLTDERVRWEQGPFDHPQLFIPDGHPASGVNPVLGASYLPDNIIELPAVGAGGRSTLAAPNNTALQAFMGLSSTPVAGPNNDQFDP